MCYRSIERVFTCLALDGMAKIYLTILLSVYEEPCPTRISIRVEVSDLYEYRLYIYIYISVEGERALPYLAYDDNIPT